MAAKKVCEEQQVFSVTRRERLLLEKKAFLTQRASERGLSEYKQERNELGGKSDFSFLPAGKNSIFWHDEIN